MSTTKTKPLLSDPDLTTPMHDKICIWVKDMFPTWMPKAQWCEKCQEGTHDDTDYEDLLKQTIGEKKREEILAIQKNNQTHLLYPWNNPPLERWHKVEWEKPLQAKSGFFIGYVDLLISYAFTSCVGNNGRWVCINYENRIFKYDLTQAPQLRAHGTNAYEVKSKIPSCGELLRQLQTYRTLLGREIKLTVVCPDDRFQSIIESQEFGFIKYTGG